MASNWNLNIWFCARKSIFFSTPVLSWVNQCRWGNWNDFVNTWNYVTRRTFLQQTDAAVCNVNSLSKLHARVGLKIKWGAWNKTCDDLKEFQKRAWKTELTRGLSILNDGGRSTEDGWKEKKLVGLGKQWLSASIFDKWYIFTKYQSDTMTFFFVLNVE